MDGGAWWAAVHGVTKSRTQLSNFTLTFHFHALEKEMATHSSILAWRVPGMGEPGGLPSLGLHRVGDDWSDLAAAAAATCDSFNNITLYFSTILYVILSFFLHVGCFPAMAYLVHFCLGLLKEVPLQWVFFLKEKKKSLIYGHSKPINISNLIMIWNDLYGLCIMAGISLWCYWFPQY